MINMKVTWTALCLALLVVGSFANNKLHGRCSGVDNCDCDECDMDTLEMIQHWGYPGEEHVVTCADGFVLHMFRIPHGIKDTGLDAARPPVLLQHGLDDSSFTWIMNRPEQSLAFILADAGYDVWLGNNRGNVYSLPACDFEWCWNFTFDEMAKYDLPANVNHILNATGFKTLTFVGHSQGNSHALAALSMNAQLSTKLNLVIAFAPVAFLQYQESGVISVAADLGADRLIQLFGIKQFLPLTSLSKVLGNFCTEPVIDDLCANLLFALAGKNPTVPDNNLNHSRFNVYISHAPSGTSVKNIVHWAQMIRNPRFGFYDYGPFGNLATYGQLSPPDYPLQDIKTPFAIFTGGNDFVVAPQDLAHLEQLLSVNSNIIYSYNIPSYDHMDFVWGLDAHQVLYPKVLEVLNKYAHPKLEI